MFTRPLTDAEKLQAILFMRRFAPDSEILKVYTAPKLPLRRADERLKARVPQ